MDQYKIAIAKKCKKKFKNIRFTRAAQENLPVPRTDNDVLAIYWGSKESSRTTNYAVAETGFFWDCGHMDTIGLYNRSSLNTKLGIERIKNFTPPVDVINQILSSNHISKYRQRGSSIEWPGVVFACQVPNDKAIKCVSKDKYYEFITKCCKYYGSDLLLKLHPKKKCPNILKIAGRYKCRAMYTNLDCLDKCEHVITFSSTMAVDCFLRNVPVKQGYPGYFYNTGAVTKCNGNPSTKLKDTTKMGKKLVHFLIWKYCIRRHAPVEVWEMILKAFASSGDIFPLPEDLSYGQMLLDCKDL